MEEKSNSQGYKNILEELQLQSWQLELLISGFAIFGLFQLIEPVKKELNLAQLNEDTLNIFLVRTFYPTLVILLIMLLIHVLLRGVWIGALGLRYVSGDINYHKLNYSEKFTNLLTKKVGSFDDYIVKLEDICSTLFALAFLLVFYFMALMSVIGFFILMVNIVEILGVFSEENQTVFEGYTAFFYFSAASLVLIDFLGLGILKKGKLRPKIYYPIYRFFSVITLAFLYRPLVYNFLDLKVSKWISTYLLPGYLLFGAIFGPFSYKASNFLDKNAEGGDFFANRYNYEELIDPNLDRINFATIPSKVINESFLHLKIPFTQFKENALMENDSTLQMDDERGYGFHGDNIEIPFVAISLNKKRNDTNAAKRFMNSVNKAYELQIDSTVILTDFIYSVNQNGRFQFETFIKLKGFKEGKHLLRIIGPSGKRVGFNQKIVRDTLVQIPFWYFPDSVETHDLIQP